ncbi:MAG: hypothetical protein Tp185DCM00d2C31949971_54 [Prokaryotic dsDNA virus sp.]|uniref:hypothetical protein n=1 Tax=Gammaproteobacteria TaxID=1236 RepID=UPI000C3E45BC|nr:MULTISPECIES: hypothetical protein [Gammaproteobacteria]MBP58930.1 hypothetical protein [Idiomarina sp.]QDP60938.1 MAG: hypothetical protein Tp185DCM00d2C31949971_54 [Prokaryotic dsDNA virus sp.]QDP61793.1 MAG: hypothetical protein Tp1111MES1053591_32 [Prokaryotic dsDNA virus sp.]HCC80398.1 hypothetical protein [Methylophaga sp.]|tara:strand:+ start:6341 stop:6742 length:402 start_codon:yes stop_codon:yes gene_type:complete
MSILSRTFIFLDDQRRDKIKVGLYECLKSLPADKKYRITVQDYVEDKTAEQRAFFHTLCGIFADETGYTKGEIKELCKFELMGTTVVNLAGREIEVVKSSETLKKQEYSELIETCYRLAAEAGIQLPNARWAA